jgi:hypothetical protein
MILLFIGKYFLLRFTNNNPKDLDDLENYCNSISKRATEAKRFSGSGQRGVAVRIRCRQNQLQPVCKNVLDAVPNTTVQSVEDIGYITFDDKTRFRNAIKFLQFPAIVFLVTLGTDSGITSALKNVDINHLDIFLKQFTPIFLKAIFVAIPPTITAVVAVAKKKIGQ